MRRLSVRPELVGAHRGRTSEKTLGFLQATVGFASPRLASARFARVYVYVTRLRKREPIS